MSSWPGARHIKTDPTETVAFCFGYRTPEGTPCLLRANWHYCVNWLDEQGISNVMSHHLPRLATVQGPLCWALHGWTIVTCSLIFLLLGVAAFWKKQRKYFFSVCWQFVIFCQNPIQKGQNRHFNAKSLYFEIWERRKTLNYSDFYVCESHFFLKLENCWSELLCK
jgi:hypothetical protein